MNIYATGMNPADANALKRAPRVAIFQAFGAMMDVLKLKEKATWKATRVGDPLPVDTDAVIVSMLLPRSLNCPYALGAIYAASEALQRDIPLILYMTDWAFFKAAAEYRSIAKAGTPYFSKQIGGAPQYNENPNMIATYGNQLVNFCDMYGDLNAPLWEKAKIMIPKYTNWGKMSIIERMIPGASTIYPMDPTPAFLEYIDPVVDMINPLEGRLQHWLWPSLLKDSTWLDKQGLQWPVDRFGPKGFPVVEDERAVHLLYRERMGALCPPYPTAGSGWWRSRWIHATMAGTILACGLEDMWEASEWYASSGRMIETYPPERLQRIADQQQEEMLLKLQMNHEVMVEQIYAPFREAGL